MLKVHANIGIGKSVGSKAVGIVSKRIKNHMEGTGTAKYSRN